MENLAPNVIRKVSKELADLIKQPPEGIKIIPNDEDVSDIQAIVEGPGMFFLSTKNHVFVLIQTNTLTCFLYFWFSLYSISQRTFSC